MYHFTLCSGHTVPTFTVGAWEGEPPRDTIHYPPAPQRALDPSARLRDEAALRDLDRSEARSASGRHLDVVGRRSTGPRAGCSWQRMRLLRWLRRLLRWWLLSLLPRMRLWRPSGWRRLHHLEALHGLRHLLHGGQHLALPRPELVHLLRHRVHTPRLRALRRLQLAHHVRERGAVELAVRLLGVGHVVSDDLLRVEPHLQGE